MPVNEYDFDMMQEEAIRQAREMFRRSSPMLPDPEPEFSRSDAGFDDYPGQNSKDQGMGTLSFEKPKVKNFPNLFGGLVKDKDTVLLLAVILLLFSDGGDRLLILALIYIMS